MNRVRLLTVEHTFWLERPGVQMLVVHPNFAMPDDWSKRGWKARTETVLVVTPEGQEFEATAQINLTHLNIRGPDIPISERWKITMWLTDRRPEEVPVGSEIRVSPEVRNAVLPNCLLK